jgi:hypothetical protein
MNREIRDAVRKLSGTFNKADVNIIWCNVDSVDETNQTCNCTPVSGKYDTQLQGVKLTAQANDGLLIIPSVDSTVGVIYSTQVEPYVILYSNIDKIVFNGGALGGLIKIKDLVDKINRLENAFNSHVHILTLSSGTGTAAPPAPPISPLTLQTDLEDKNFTH